MKRIAMFFAFFVYIGLQISMAQTMQITGTITSSEDKSPLIGATVRVNGTTIGVTTNSDGMYSIAAPATAKTLKIMYVGMKTQEIAIGGRAIIDLEMEPESVGLEEVVVTALGITREKKSLGYATQEVKGDQVSTVKTDNFLNSLSGKISGLQITKTTNIGGSTNIQIRGANSLTNNTQALFVVDGVPISNDNTNTQSQSQAGAGYDFGNAASDINPEDIESINVLKGAAASALYGSRAANGVIMITTKKGSPRKNTLGVTVNSNLTIGFVDKSTFPTYQTQYGGGYGHYYGGPDNNWYMRDLNNDGIDEQWAVTSEDASYGAKFDPSLMVYQWDAVDKQSPNYMKATPWVAAKNGPITFFEHPVTYTNTVAIANASDQGAYRLSYTNFKQNGILPNSELIKNNLLMNGSWNVNKNLTVAGSANFIRTSSTGRNSTGYNDNIMGSFRQWFQTNVDIKEQKDAYFKTQRNITWNWADPTDEEPIFWDNPYWIRYENYESDSRNRFIGYLTIDYKVSDWLSLFGRASTDFFSGLEEERKAIGSVPGQFGIGTGSADDGSIGRKDVGSGYLRRDISSSEDNFDLMAKFNKKLNDNISLNGVIGSSIRRSNYDRIILATNGGLGIDRDYAIQNSLSPLLFPKEYASKIGVNGIYANLSLGYKNYLYLEGSLRRDHASTLPVKNSSYYYPSVSSSFIFSELLKNSWLSMGKVRLNYAEVGNSAGFDRLLETYRIITPLNSPITSVKTTKNDPDLKPERTRSIEGGLEMNFFNNLFGFDLAAYKTNTINQILPLSLSTATGFNFQYINAGEIENKGVELGLSVSPIKGSFKWDLHFNWSKNWNKVLSLYKNIQNYQLGSFQQGITINAKVGEPLGELNGTDFTYLNGQKVINALNGQYIPSSNSDNNIGHTVPDWKGGILNSFSYKNWTMSFLIDVQQGGKIFSLDMAYGLATGLYKETAYTNDLGNPVRNTLANGGGFINPGVNEDGSINKTRIRADRYGAMGYARGLPNSAFVYDASYVKLREVSLSYSLPAKLLQKTFIKDIAFSAVGSNVWIIHKNLPYADPESGLGAGKLQGFTTGSLPSTRDFGFDVKLSF